MNYKVPHSLEKVKIAANRKNFFNLRKANEKRVAVEVDITCPRISWNSDGDLILLEPITSHGQLLSLNLPNHFTSLPLPLFQPTQVKCGIGMCSNEVYKNTHPFFVNYTSKIMYSSKL